ncbi:DUF6327 family protein [Flavobacterium sp.]|uniref:DUF6327 family protein n=1 Tax=Flavobacterium sp. TaxID=239 RepID=UPI0024871FAE|nr:DUF6327 family protein [Flavobacterium sp.]MDI1317547.1 DUF6327 family protein [Flavobacterium sp.]
METKKYSSYAQIELDLKILKLEREIYYQKVLLNVDKTKESIIPFRKINKVLETVSDFSSGPYGIIIKTLIPTAIKWYLNRKRGN